eukprot:6203881-Pleurochrysis_carterae.AAC.2
MRSESVRGRKGGSSMRLCRKAWFRGNFAPWCGRRAVVRGDEKKPSRIDGFAQPEQLLRAARTASGH